MIEIIQNNLMGTGTTPQQRGYKLRTGIQCVFVTNQAGFDTGFSIENRKTSTLNYAWGIWNADGSLNGSITTASLAANKMYQNMVSITNPGAQGIMICWDTDNIDDGPMDTFAMFSFMTYTTGGGILTANMFGCVHPIDRRGETANFSGKMQFPEFTLTGYGTAIVFWNPNYYLYGASAIGGTLSGRTTPLATLASGINGNSWKASTDTTTSFSSGVAAFWDNCLMNSGLSGTTAMFTGITPANDIYLETFNVPNEIMGCFFVADTNFTVWQAGKNFVEFIQD